jgi:hypothetical protein
MYKQKDEKIYNMQKSKRVTMSMNKYARHTPAFILLFLAQKPAYDALLFK